MARVFGRYRSAHEIDAAHIVPLAAAAVRGGLSPQRARWELRRRNLRFGLEVDSAAFLSPFVPQLAESYPRARFLVLIRDCFSWLDSAVENHARTDVMRSGGSRHWRLMVRAIHGDGGPYEPADRPLEVRGLPSVDSYLRQWASRYTGLLAQTPSDRRLVLRTEDIDASRELLAQSFDLEPSTLEIGVHANVTPTRDGILGEVSASHVLGRAEHYCAPLMERFWGPHWRRLAPQ
jgi:hypothetical protein